MVDVHDLILEVESASAAGMAVTKFRCLDELGATKNAIALDLLLVSFQVGCFLLIANVENCGTRSLFLHTFLVDPQRKNGNRPVIPTIFVRS